MKTWASTEMAAIEDTMWLTELGRAMEAPQIRRIFSCSPRDPRYHMLEHLSPKFKMPPMEREPRAALILNRFTRTLTVMFATNAVSSILGVCPDQIKNKSFYECIQEKCLNNALECLESAKANDSIAYLRFWYRDPRRDEDLAMSEEDDRDEDEGDSRPGADAKVPLDTSVGVGSSSPADTRSNGLPGERSCVDAVTQQSGHQAGQQPLELEAVVSCTSDGVVVVLRKARPPIPADHPPLLPFDFEDGLFAAPWGQRSTTPSFPPESLHNFQPPLLPQFMPVRENVKAGVMRSIRDVAVFAWGVTSINGDVAAYGRGFPTGEARLPSRRLDSGARSPARAHDPWGGGSLTKEVGPGETVDLGHGSDDRLGRPAASNQRTGGPRYRASGQLPSPPTQPRQHHRARANSPTSREHGGCYPSSWTEFTDADCGRPDGRSSYRRHC